MNTKSGVLIAVSLMATTAAFSQQTETDDMYFSSKDRVKTEDSKVDTKLNSRSSKSMTIARTSQVEDTQYSSILRAGSSVNPTDSYSARGENPEYASSSQQNGQSDAQYFVPNYQPTGVNQTLGNNGYNSGYN